jgi:hypothetical protein
MPAIVNLIVGVGAFVEVNFNNGFGHDFVPIFLNF